jgi:hypothetical protein
LIAANTSPENLNGLQVEAMIEAGPSFGPTSRETADATAVCVTITRTC